MRSILYTLITLSIISGQARIGDWESFTSTLNVNETIQYNNLLVSATDGGLLIYNTDQGTFSELNISEGLLGTKLNCIELGNSGMFWIGGSESNGFIQLYDLNLNHSIAEFNYDMSEIIDIAVSDSIIYAVYRNNNDHGLIELNYLNNEFIHKDIYQNWPDNSKINGIKIYEDQVWVGTEIGIYYGRLGTDPNTWIGYPDIPKKNIQSMDLLNNLLYFYSGNLLHLIDLNDLTYSTLEHFNSDDIIQVLITENGSIYYLTHNLIYIASNSSNKTISFKKNTINSISGFDHTEVMLSTNSGIAFIDNKDNLEYLIPNTLHENKLQAITILKDGRIVAAGNNGITIKESTGWRSIVKSDEGVVIQANKNYNYFIADSIPVDFGVTVSKIEQGPDDKLYCSIEGTYPKRNGGGVLIIDVDDPSDYTIIDTTYLDYYADEYLVVKDIEFDRNGNLWVADAFASNKHEPVHIRSLSGDWFSYNADNNNLALGLTPNTIAIDAWQRVWVGQFQYSEINSGFANGGISMLSYDGDPWSPNNYEWHRINLTNTDINETIWSLAISDDNRMYLLTPLGLTFADLQYSVDDPIKYESPRYYFPNISFGQESEVRLDARDNAWAISSSDGIHVLLRNSTFWPDNNDNLEVESINTDNYPLLSNTVTDIAFNNEKGIAYISTASGINSFRIPFAESKENYSNARVFPSPFHVPSNRTLIIDNLKDKSSLKVLTINGSVIRSLKDSELGIHGYQIEWDGRDESGNWVSSGVYLLTVYSEDGSYSTAKVAIIRH